MRIRNLEVTKLFGVFHHAVSFNLEDRITIIHGPNGFGKTALLRMVHALLENRFSALNRIPFETLTVTLENGDQIRADKSQLELELDDPKSSDAEPPLLTIKKIYANGDVKTHILPKMNVKDLNFPLEILEREIPDLERIDRLRWLQTSTGRTLSLEELLDQYSHYLPNSIRSKQPIPEWLTESANQADVRFIEAQRLFSLSSSNRHSSRYERGFEFKAAVALYSEDLAKVIQQKQAEYGANSQLLDSTFPARVLKQQQTSLIHADDLKNKLNELELKRQRISSAGLLSLEENVPVFDANQTVDVATKHILSLYVADVEAKLSVFNELTEKIEVFKRTINKRFSYKKLHIDKQTGFQFISKHGSLKPTDLSSGEQHEIVLFYELLFKTKQNALILVDEPELSLHVAWQVEFLQDISEITKLSSFDVFIATHSPQIINNRWDLTVELKGPRE